MRLHASMLLVLGSTLGLGAGVVHAATVNCTAGAAFCRGTDDVDDIYGSGLGDDISGLDEGDTIYGLSGDDYVVGGYGPNNPDFAEQDGDDTIDGGLGDDTLYGEKGGDTIYGRDGDDVLYGDGGSIPQVEGHDKLYGNDGADKFFGAGGSDLFVGGSGADFVNARDDEGVNPGIDTVRLGSGNDGVYAVDDHKDIIDCGRGRRDEAYYDRDLDKVTDCEIKHPT